MPWFCQRGRQPEVRQVVRAPQLPSRRAFESVALRLPPGMRVAVSSNRAAAAEVMEVPPLRFGFNKPTALPRFLGAEMSPSGWSLRSGRQDFRSGRGPTKPVRPSLRQEDLRMEASRAHLARHETTPLQVLVYECCPA